MKTMLPCLLIGFLIPFQVICQESLPLPDYSVKAYVKYANAEGTPMQGTKVLLMDLQGNPVDSGLTNNHGYLQLNNLSPGTYRLIVAPAMDWAGVNATDAMLAFGHFMETSLLSGVSLKSADADGSNYINSTDAMLIMTRAVGLRENFPAGDWYFESPTIQVTGETSIIHMLSGSCMGDVNGSNIPPSQPGFNCGTILTDTRNDKTYTTVQIGSQCWMSQNLNIGDNIPGNQASSNNSIIEKYCHGNSIDNCRVYGGLYDWNEMMQYYSSPGGQGICPTGWHLPTNDEYCVMLNAIESGISCTQTGFLGLKLGGKLKEAGYTHWSSPNTDASNESGFTALGAGMGYSNGFFTGLMFNTYFWTSSQHSNPNNAIYLSVTSASGQAMRNGTSKSNRASVRCVLD